MYGLFWYGQSLAMGAFGLPLLVPFAPLPYMLMMHNTVSGQYAINQGSTIAQAASVFDKIVPAYDQYLGTGNTNPGQTSTLPEAEVLSSLQGGTPTAPIFQLLLDMGVGGQAFANLGSPSTFYTNAINGVTGAVNNLPSGFVLNIPAIHWVQGEADCASATSRATYAGDLNTIEGNLSASISTATSQVNTTLPMLYPQETNCYGPFSTIVNAQNIMGAQWDAAVAHPTTLSLISPLYMLENNNQQSGHLTARGYFYLGEYMARAYYNIVPIAQGGLGGSYFAPRPTTASIANSGAVVTIPFTGGTAPYLLDCSYVTSPNGALDGFFYTDSSGSPPHIVSVAASGSNILLTLSGTPSHAVTGTVEYAWSAANGEGGLTPGPTSGLRGCMHDSDPYVSILDAKPLPNYSIAWNATFTTS